MQNGFNKFKKRIWRDVWIKCLIWGASCALFAVGTVLLVLKLTQMPLLYCLTGIAALPLGFGVAFLLTKTNDLKIAKRLDSHFALNEKVQTFVEYRSNDGVMAQLQRQDTLSKLDAIPTKQLPFGKLWLYVVVGVVAISLFTVGVALPKAQAEEPYEPPVWQGGEWERQALDELIAYVGSSSADSTIMKPRTLTSLNTLRTLLKTGVKESDLPTFVGVTSSEISNITLDANAQAGITQAQKDANNEVSAYVIKRLYEIFSLTPPAQPTNPDNPDEEESGGIGGGGSGDMTFASNDKFFHPVLGEITYGEAIEEYFGRIDKAFEEGIISYDEWYDYVMLYFRYLYGTEK